MPLPQARPGLVFRYEYVWKRQALAGQTIGEKERPACIVLAIEKADTGTRVLIVPITTQPPPESIPAIEIPIRVRRYLGLADDRPSWIILSEANIDVWPSPDIRPIPGSPSRFEYGLLPLKLTNAVRAAVLAAVTSRRLDVVNRSADDTPPSPAEK